MDEEGRHKARVGDGGGHSSSVFCYLEWEVGKERRRDLRGEGGGRTHTY